MSVPPTIVVRIRARPGMEDRVERELRALLAPTRQEVGRLNFDLHRAEGDPGLLVHENWTDGGALDRHFETPWIRAWLEAAPALLAEPMELTRWRRVG